MKVKVNDTLLADVVQDFDAEEYDLLEYEV